MDEYVYETLRRMETLLELMLEIMREKKGNSE